MKPSHQSKFDETVSILVKAYLNNQLEHRICTACAVGNIVAHHLGTKPKVLTTGNHRTVHDNYYFDDGTFMTWWNGCLGEHKPSDQQQLTGYTVEELNRIELAFEFAEGVPDFSTGMSQDKTMNEAWMFNGLMAVVEELAKIHCISLEEEEQAKKRFVKESVGKRESKRICKEKYF